MVKFCTWTAVSLLPDHRFLWEVTVDACWHWVAGAARAAGDSGGSAWTKSKGLLASSSSTRRVREPWPRGRGSRRDRQRSCCCCCCRLRSRWSCCWCGCWRRGGLRRLGWTGRPGRMAAAATGQQHLPPAYLENSRNTFSPWESERYGSWIRLGELVANVYIRSIYE